jgi:hypothetical protein
MDVELLVGLCIKDYGHIAFWISVVALPNLRDCHIYYQLRKSRHLGVD